MGYRARTYRLVFTDPGLHDLEVTARGGTIDDLVRLMYLTGLGRDLLAPDRDQERVELYQMLDAGLTGWNLEDDQGQPVPLTAQMLRAQEWSLVMAIVHAWMAAQASVSGPLEPTSSDGPPSVEVSLPVEVLSPSPPS